MKEWRGWSFPDGETHLIEWMQTTNDVRHGRPTYQAKKYDEALDRCGKRRRVAVDVGANVGLWSWLMSFDFNQVQAFEPVPLFAECWHRNIGRKCFEVELHEIALGAASGNVSMISMTQGSCGDTTVDAGQGGSSMGDVEMRTLDSFAFEDVDLIKCDNEGYELFVMQGAVQTLKRCRPVVIVEQKPGHGKTFGIGDTAAVQFLEGLGMRLWRVMAGDYVMVW